MGVTMRFTQGMALYIAEHIEPAAWKPTGSYASNEIGITIRHTPQQPDGLIVLSPYGVSNAPTLSDSVLGLQIKTRRVGADPALASDLADELFDRLHGLHDIELPSPDDQPGVFLNLLEWRSQTSGGQDANQRWTEIQNFYATIHAPSAHRT